MTVFAGLTHRLLVHAARAHQDGYESLRWDELAERAGPEATYRRVSSALRHLADAGLVEGVVTPSGWYQIRVTPRGYVKVRRDLQRPVESFSEAEPVRDQEPDEHALLARFKALDQQLIEQSKVLDHVLAEQTKAGTGKAKAAISPALSKAAEQTRGKLTAARGHLALAWHTLTTFP